MPQMADVFQYLAIYRTYRRTPFRELSTDLRLKEEEKVRQTTNLMNAGRPHCRPVFYTLYRTVFAPRLHRLLALDKLPVAH